MSDTSLNKIIQYGTSTDRIAFTPDPASGSQVLYLWYETDNPPDTFAWDGSAWVQIGGGGGGGSITSGTYASLPGSPATGDVYLFTDSIYTCAQYNGATWDYFLNGKLAVPPGPKSGWTNVNAGSDMTVTDGAGTIDITIIRNAGLNWRLITKTLAPPYVATFYYRAQQEFSSTQTTGVYFYDGTKLMGLEFVSQINGACTIRVNKMNSVTSDNSQFAGRTSAPLYVGGVYLRLGNDSSTLSFEWSLDGITYQTLATEAVGTFITPTQYGIGGVSVTSVAGDPINLSVQSVMIS